jgi:cysteinyl-tRNA synthetase
MSWRYLGEIFDIHGGGIDLVFPHHENEIAQSRCAFHTPVMANYWMHNGFLQVEGEKMSKSLGNFATINELLKDWPGEAVRLAMLQTHYRQPLNWTVKGLEESERELDRWYPVVSQFPAPPAPMVPPEFLNALEDDLNTPAAITVLRNLYQEAVRGVSFSGQKLSASGRLVGLFQDNLSSWLQRKHEGFSPSVRQQVDDLIAARNAARKSKNFAESDRIRDELARMGVVLKDTKEGTTWEIAR